MASISRVKERAEEQSSAMNADQQATIRRRERRGDRHSPGVEPGHHTRGLRQMGEPRRQRRPLGDEGPIPRLDPRHDVPVADHQPLATNRLQRPVTIEHAGHPICGSRGVTGSAPLRSPRFCWSR